jgi:hypothetical protein
LGGRSDAEVGADDVPWGAGHGFAGAQSRGRVEHALVRGRVGGEDGDLPPLLDDIVERDEVVVAGSAVERGPFSSLPTLIAPPDTPAPPGRSSSSSAVINSLRER